MEGHDSRTPDRGEPRGARRSRPHSGPSRYPSLRGIRATSRAARFGGRSSSWARSVFTMASPTLLKSFIWEPVPI